MGIVEEREKQGLTKNHYMIGTGFKFRLSNHLEVRHISEYEAKKIIDEEIKSWGEPEYRQVAGIVHYHLKNGKTLYFTLVDW